MPRSGEIKVRRGDVIDGWSIQRELGAGGNGSVWVARHPDHGKAALKVLKQPNGYTRQRFSDEARAQMSLRDQPGVLPLLATNALEEPTPIKVWLATPRAEGLKDALGDEPDLSAVVDAVLAYADTLGKIAKDGIHHRDIKPDNLFRFDGRWVLGDFGLVDYPGKPEITAPSRRLGPLFFLAPEMLREPDSADAGPADVYSLAKTLWVLATGQRYPPDGQIMADIETHSLSYWLAGKGSVALQLILMTATADDPVARPSMVDFAQQLRDWSAGDVHHEDRAARFLHASYIQRLGESLANSLDLDAIGQLETATKAMFDEARKNINLNTRATQDAAVAEATASIGTHLRKTGMKGALGVHDTVWIGPISDGSDVVDAVMAQPVDERDADLYRGWQTLMGRPLLWMQSVALIGALRLRGVAGCEPRATEMAKLQIRNHLLSFPDDERFAAAWRFQRALIRSTVRLLGFAPIESQAQRVREALPVEAQVVYRPRASLLMMNLTTTTVKQQLLSASWTAESLTQEAQKAEQALRAIPIPSTRWEGPAGDPWLTSWDQTDPLIQSAIGILDMVAAGDDLIRADAEVVAALRAIAETAHPIDQHRATAILKRSETA